MKLEIQSDFVIANQDVRSGDVITFLDAGEWRTLPNDPEKKVLTFKVRLASGVEKFLSINKTSQTELMSAWGVESADWIGKSARVSIEKTRAFGKIVWPIYLEAADKEITDEEIPVINAEKDETFNDGSPVPDEEV